MSTVLVLSPIWIDSTQNVIEKLKALNYQFFVLTSESINDIPEEYQNYCLFEIGKAKRGLLSLIQRILILKPSIIHLVLPKLNLLHYRNIFALIFILRSLSRITFILTIEDLEIKRLRLLSLFDGVEVTNKKYVPKIRKLRLVSAKQIQIPSAYLYDSRVSGHLQDFVQVIGKFKLQVHSNFLNLISIDNESLCHRIDNYKLSELCYLIKAAQAVDFSSLDDAHTVTLFMVQLAKQHGKAVQLSLKQRVTWDYLESPSLAWEDVADYAVNSLERVYKSSQLKASARKF